MDATIFLGIGIVVVGSIAYLIGHTHGKSSSPLVIVTGAGGSGGAPTTSTKDDGTRTQDAQ